MSEQKLDPYIHLEPKLYRVKIRRDWPVKPEAEQIDGKVFAFIYGMMLSGYDIYPNECLMFPDDENYPTDAPDWIASGDLIPEGEL